MKKLSIILFCFIVTGSVAQDYSKPLEIPEGIKVANYGFTDEGSFYMTTQKRVLSAKDKDATFEKFNSVDLELDLTHKPDEQFRIRESSPFGDTFLYDNSASFSFNSDRPSSFLFSDGSTKTFEGEEWLPKDFIPISEFISKDYYVCIGHEKGRDKYKENGNDKVLQKQYKFFRRDLKTFESIYTDFELYDDIQVEEETVFPHKYLFHNDNDFTFFTKNFTETDKKGKHPKKVEYILSVYNFEGKLIKTKILTNEIDDKRLDFIGDINLGPGSFEYVTRYSNIRKDWIQVQVPTIISSGNVYNDTQNKAYYTFGIIKGDRKTKDKCMLMVDKFDYSGKKIWSKSFEQPTRSKKGQGFDEHVTSVHIVNTGKEIAFALPSFKNDYLKIMQVSKENGDITATQEYGNYKRNQLNGFGNFDNMYTNEFVSDFVFKDNFDKKFILDYETVIAYSLNPNFKDFLDRQKEPERKLNFITNITDNGIVTIMANNKDNDFKLLKFNW